VEQKRVDVDHLDSIVWQCAYKDVLSRNSDVDNALCTQLKTIANKPVRVI
jgi:hypothetical protein